MAKVCRKGPPIPALIWHFDFGDALPALDAQRLLALLAAIDTHASLGPAAQALDLSYRSAWGVIERAEAALGQPLTVKGRGQGTRLSAFGEKLLGLEREARAVLETAHAPWQARLSELLAPGEAVSPIRLRLSVSHDTALADWVEHGRGDMPDIRWLGSEAALLALARGETDAAGVHWPAGWPAERVAAWLDRWIDVDRYHFYPVMTREQGILVANGNPLGITGVADMAQPGILMVNRQRGSGTRGMVDELLAANGLSARDIEGYAHEEFTHDAVASLIASGKADVGFGIRAVATRYDLGFLPLGVDRYFLVARPTITRSPAMQQLLRRLQGQTFQQRLAALTGYQHLAGEDGFLPWRQLRHA